MLQPPTTLIPGKIGLLEAIIDINETSNTIALICHPHPLFGGTMTNKVVSTLARAFHEAHFSTVCFNFRGVGKSEGTYAEGIGEQDDVITVMNWINQTYPDKKISLAGFSFGAAMSAQVAARIPVERLISIAPPVPRFGLVDLPPITCPWLIVQGEEDDVVIPQDVYDWVETREPKPILKKMPGAGHFFHGMLMELRDVVAEILR